MTITKAQCEDCSSTDVMLHAYDEQYASVYECNSCKASWSCDHPNTELIEASQLDMFDGEAHVTDIQMLVCVDCKAEQNE